MANLTNKKIKDTYEGLIKTNDNAAISGEVELTDGLGNGTGVSISTDGRVVAEGIVSFGSLKDTGENITITKFVDEADGIGNNDNDTSIPTSAAVKDYVDTNVTAQDLDFQGDSGTGAVDLDSQVLSIAGTANEIETSASGQTLTIGLVDSPTVSGTFTAGNLQINNALTVQGTTTFSGDVICEDVIDMGSNQINNLADPIDDQDAVTKNYVDTQVTAQDLDFSGNTGTGDVDLDSETFEITGVNGITTIASNNTLQIDGSEFQSDIQDLDTRVSANESDIATNTTKLAGIESGAQVNTVDSVNTQTGAVVLDADDIDDASTTNKWSTAAEKTKLGYISVTQAVDLDSIEQKQNSQFKAIGLATDFGFRVLSDSGKVEGTQCIMENMEILILN